MMISPNWVIKFFLKITDKGEYYMVHSSVYLDTTGLSGIPMHTYLAKM